MSHRVLIEKARLAEQRGELDEAVKLFAQAGEAEEAARVLVARGDFPRAGRLLFRAVGLPMERLHEADADQRKLAVKAAICLAKAGETGNAVTLFVAAGDMQRAAEVLERGGDTAGAAKLRAQQPQRRGETRVGAAFGQLATASHALGRRLEEQGDQAGALTQYIKARAHQDAGRVARQLGKLEQAGELFEEGSYFYEAAVCYHDARDMRRCLGALLRVGRDHARYRAACSKAIEISAQLGEVSFELDQLVARFVASGPADTPEIDAFYELGLLYEKIGFPDNARECYQKLLDKQPGHVASARLRELSVETRGSNMVYERILREDGAFRGDGPRAVAEPPSSTFAVLAELPELPELPGARKAGPTAAAPRAPTVIKAAPTPVPAAESPREASPPVAALELTPGALVAGRYRLEQKLGQGGTAAVFRATDLELEEEVAIKIFTTALDDPDMVRRFKQELSVTRKLSHPNVVRLHDIGSDRGFRFLTMEVLTGEDLASRMACGPVPLPEALDYLLQAARGLALAHAHGVVHRDIKPENFFITDQGVLKVMDFGIAKKEAAQKRTQAGFIAGTPPYMSPEQISGFADVTALADIYSLGVVAYELCAGLLPFQHEELMPLLVMHMTEKPASPIGHNANIPRELSELILKLLEKEPQKRVQSMTELASQLEALRKIVR